MLGLAVIATIFTFPAIALGVVDGPCSGTVTIDGEEYDESNDTPDDPIVIPDKPGLIASWTGQTDDPITEHNGPIGIVIGPTTWQIEDWEGANAESGCRREESPATPQHPPLPSGCHSFATSARRPSQKGPCNRLQGEAEAGSFLPCHR